jgi:DNA-directed RNA polymerase subunit omega
MERHELWSLKMGGNEISCNLPVNDDSRASVGISDFELRIAKWGEIAITFREYPSSAPSPINIMKPELIKAASEVVPNQQILINMVSRRVRQLCRGHRPLVEYAPGLREADIALTEIINKKLTFESTFGQNGKDESPQVVQFPGIIVAKPTKKKAA